MQTRKRALAHNIIESDTFVKSLAPTETSLNRNESDTILRGLTPAEMSLAPELAQMTRLPKFGEREILGSVPYFPPSATHRSTSCAASNSGKDDGSTPSSSASANHHSAAMTRTSLSFGLNVGAFHITQRTSSNFPSISSRFRYGGCAVSCSQRNESAGIPARSFATRDSCVRNTCAVAKNAGLIQYDSLFFKRFVQ